MLAVQIHEVDGEAHAEGVHGFAGKYPQALAGSEPFAAQQALSALFAFVGDFRAVGQYRLASEVADAHTKVRSFPAAREPVEYARKDPGRQSHEVVFSPFSIATLRCLRTSLCVIAFRAFSLFL
jgi:hypothetical protein